MLLNRIAMTFLLMLVLIASSGCAVMNRENRPLLEGLDAVARKSSLTESTTAKIALAPVALAVGTAAVTIDMAIITPSLATIPALADTSSWVWEKPQGSELRQVMLFLPKVAITPLVFTTDWAFRSLFTTRF